MTHAGLCESPLTFQAIMIWRNEFNKGEVLLRDLDATYAGPDAKAMSAPAIGPDGHANIGVAVPCRPGRPPQIPAPARASRNH
jgi:hypothetical protein